MTMTGAGGAGSQGQGQPAQQWNLYIDINIFKYPYKLLFVWYAWHKFFIVQIYIYN